MCSPPCCQSWLQPFLLYIPSFLMDISRRMFAVLAVLGSQWILASYAQESITPSPTSSSVPIQTHIISVGIDHKFKPEVTQAEIGDVIDFQFFPPNHSVVRAEYEMPCIPYEMSGGRGKVGFFSGFHPVDAILDEVCNATTFRGSGPVLT